MSDNLPASMVKGACLPKQLESNDIAHTNNRTPYDPLAELPDPKDSFRLYCTPLEEIAGTRLPKTSASVLDSPRHNAGGPPVAVPHNGIIGTFHSLQSSTPKLYMALLGDLAERQRTSPNE